MEPRERRQQILSEAATLFGERGYHQTSVSDIIAAAGIARGTFYLYFESKRAIFEELLDELVLRLLSAVKPIVLEAGAPPASVQLEDNIVRVIELFVADRPLLAILLKGAVGLDKGFDEKLSGFYERLRLLVELSLEAGEEVGLVRPCDRRVAALCGIGAMKELLADLLEAPAGHDVDVRARARALLAVFSHGVLIADR